MSYERSSALESQPTTFRREDDPEYRDDPEFTHFSESLSEQLFELTSKIGKLSQQINLLGTKRDTDRVRERIHDLLDDARDSFKKAGEGVKKLSTWEDLGASQRYTQQKLSREFQASGTEFQSIQRTALEKQRASTTAARAALDTGESGDQPYRDEPQQTQEQEQPRLASQDEVDFQESLIVERESEIRNIEQSVGELNELFRDVAHIVHEQGVGIDSIADNVQNVAQDTRHADLELRSANRYQKSARGKACCLLVILAIVLVIIILAVVLG
ncbi:uncharacterized protein KY384_006869 [Bacidia gigantensis]|uniref:uncharacterized protein n=1 Tax=Bacidia gigantensis TaxID=2732470 RepID=UPI001D050265|nr:uncharacterized protein KY384_006869 [Bacidia gigantensis]KAG8527953.1 hypothetical protein KY384_006869 [Bacidia gigantensis]